jgi:hypothetical protein
MIELKITDLQDTQTYKIITAPLVSSPIIAETDVTTIDNNISTYYTGTKRQFTIDLGWMSKADYTALVAFRDRQYTDLKYPLITITGDENINVTNLPAKMTLNAQNVADHCGTVTNIQVVFRESKQMP